jgi:hypothetical protein
MYVLSFRRMTSNHVSASLPTQSPTFHSSSFSSTLPTSQTSSPTGVPSDMSSSLRQITAFEIALVVLIALFLFITGAGFFILRRRHIKSTLRKQLSKKLLINTNRGDSHVTPFGSSQRGFPRFSMSPNILAMVAQANLYCRTHSWRWNAHSNERLRRCMENCGFENTIRAFRYYGYITRAFTNDLSQAFTFQ